ncbi:MAG: S8 family serine peptidase [Gemmobacter sp.]
MQQAWTEIRFDPSHGPRAAWEAMQEGAAADARSVTAFLQLDPGEGDPLSAIAALQGFAAAHLSPSERAMLTTEARLIAAADPAAPRDLRAVVVIPRAGLTALPAGWRVRHVGPPTTAGGDGAAVVATAAVQSWPLPAPGAEPGPPIAATIDDGIAFLNARFRDSTDRTRFRAVWLQPTGPGPDGVPVKGRVLDRAGIDAILQSDAEESDAYRVANAGLAPAGSRRSVLRGASHGTHVLDLAAGTDPRDPASSPLHGVELLAVQLPPAAIADTSGRRLETHLVQGLRWIVSEALRAAEGAGARPLVLTTSLGSLAGPGDGSDFLADWLRHEIDRYARLCRGRARLRIVAAYGNARRSRLVARAEIPADRSLRLDWRLPPDDHSPSFAELHAPRSCAGRLRLTLRQPDGATVLEDLDWPGPGQAQVLADRLGRPILAVFGAGDAVRAEVMVAMAKTDPDDGGPAAPAGCWQIQVSAQPCAPVAVAVKIQRDDTPAGYPTLGRQSWLDHPDAWRDDPETGGLGAPSPACPVTRAGTAVSFAGAAHRDILFVGALGPRAGAPAQDGPAPYSAEGLGTAAPAGHSRGPDLAARGDDSRLLGGIRGAGVLSGSVRRLSGTSAAAPQVARALIRLLLTDPALDDPRSALTGNADPSATPDARLGYGPLVAPLP